MLNAAVAAPQDGVLQITGPPGSGKTAALAARAAHLAATLPVVPERSSGSLLVICSHESGVRAFRRALASLDAPDDIRVDTAPNHLLQLLRSHYALAGVRPDLRNGGGAAAREITHEAAAGLLDLTWPELRDGELDLNIPFLSRPDKFLDEAAALTTQLRGMRVSPEEFERGSVAGLQAFYGDEVEAALAKARDPDVLGRVSKRGREALRAGPDVLQSQKRAERDLGILLARLYREYLAVARSAPLASDEDIVDECLRWLVEDGRSARAIARSITHVMVDDAEDAHAGVGDLLIALSAAGLRGITVAGWPDAAVDGLHGRRSVLSAMEPTQRIELAPNPASPQPRAQRFSDEAQEVEHLATALHDLLRQGVAPGDIALLTRSDDAAAVYADLLQRRGLPVDAPLARFETPNDIADWLALAAVVDDPYDHEHMLRVLASPLLGLSDASIYALCEDTTAVTQLALEVGVNDERKRPGKGRQRTALARNMLEGTVDNRLPDATRENVVRFRAQLDAWRTRFASIAPAAQIAGVARASGFMRRWESAPGHRRLRLLDDAQRVVEAFAAAGASRTQHSVNELVRALEDDMALLRPALRTPEAIACDTIGAAKGERWPHVFVIGLAHERFPRIYVSRAMAFSRTYGLIVRENVAPGASQTAKFAWYYARFEAKQLYLAEERRALRYGLSRGLVTASATGFGKPPRWAKDADLIGGLSTG